MIIQKGPVNTIHLIKKMLRSSGVYKEKTSLPPSVSLSRFNGIITALWSDITGPTTPVKKTPD